MTTMLKKLSPATVCPDKLIRLDIPGAPESVTLYDIYGLTNAVKKGTSEKGEWLQFRGQFEAVTAEGEVFQGGGCFIPEPMESMLYSELSQAQENDKNASVRFAIRVTIVKPTKGKASATGYEYRCSPIIQSDEDSPIKQLRAQVEAQRKLLTA